MDIRKEGIFRSDLQKIVKKGSKFGPPGPKNGHFLALFWPFSQFFGLINLFRQLMFLISQYDVPGYTGLNEMIVPPL